MSTTNPPTQRENPPSMMKHDDYKSAKLKKKLMLERYGVRISEV